ncbi:MAG: CAP domain-containing protein [Anaerolineae bacterium]|nr:CAP domain-containing protein [Anaerolineae bacterium]MDW8067855.1 CAP domain-containing protein [Anaerolineae bacterium]
MSNKRTGLLRHFIRVGGIVGMVMLAIGLARAQEEHPAARFYMLVCQARLDNGLPPYGWSSLLAAAAQRHADDLAAHRRASHVGSDGSTPARRIAEAGYAAWGNGAVVGENYWTGYGDVQDALEWFMGDPPHRENLLSSRYREIGIGVATDDEGRVYYVLDFGARPNVLPVFINDGASTTESPQVAIRLTNEEAYPQGEGNAYMGRAVEVRLSNTPDFSGASWQPWAPLLPWTLPEEPGEHWVYVQFRDGAGRTAGSADSIRLVPPGVSATPLAPTNTPTLPAPTDTPTPPPTPPPTVPLLPAPTPLPPLATPTPGLSPSPAGAPFPSPPSIQATTRTPFPTWTPLPTATTRIDGGSDPLLMLLFGLEGLAIVLGVYLALRRRG